MALSADYSTLKEKLLRMWLPAESVQTFYEALYINLVKCLRHKYMFLMSKVEEDFKLLKCFNWKEMLNDFLTVTTDKIISTESFFESISKRIDECCFDTNPPFQLDETIVTGSYSEGLFLDVG